MTTSVRPNLLVVGTSIDPHITAVLSHLPTSFTVARLDVDKYPKEHRFSLYLSEGNFMGYLSTSDGSFQLDPDILWFRRLGQPGIKERTAKRYRKFCLAEANQTLEALLTITTPKVYLNSLQATRRAAIKPLQYLLAAQMGLAVPTSLVTNDATNAHEFISHNSVVSKTLSAPLISDSRIGREFSFTQVLGSNDAPSPLELASSPVQLQNLVEPQYEVRVTSIGSIHHTVRIKSGHHNSNSGVRDWRSIEETLQYQWWGMPSEVEGALNRLLSSLNLQYAASDFIVDTAGHWHFLEANPHGAWLWLEERLSSTAITTSIANYIAGKL